MPVTARLSKRFYDQFGDETVNELVNLLNAMDTTYRDDLKEINNLNFARFDAKLEQRFAEQDAKFEKRFAEFEKRFGAIDGKLAAMETTLERTLKEHTRWMVGAWLSVILTILAVSLRG